MNGNEVSIDPYALTDILYIWNYQTGEVFQPLRFTQEKVHSLSISPDGSQIAMALTAWHLNFGKGSFELIEIRTGSCVHNFCHQECMSQSLAYSPDGKQLLIQSGFDINVHSLQTRNVGSTREYASHYGDIMAFLPGGESIISRYPDSLKIWGTEKLRSATVPQGPSAELETIENLVDIKRVFISPNGHFLVSEDDAGLKLWDLSGETNVESSPQDPEYKIQAQLGICSDGLSLRRASRPDPAGIRPELSSSQISASWVNGRTVAAYNLRTLEVWKLGPAIKHHFAFETPGEQQIMAVALSANDEYLAVAYGTTLKVWALKDSFRASDPKIIEQVVAMALSPNGSILALASFSTI
ncbi:Vegetative incompatibility protein HET-E-1-like protein 15 [Fusarium oxysporum f. sp. phaseoli]